MNKKWSIDDIKGFLSELSEKNGFDCKDIPILFSKRFTRAQGQINYKRQGEEFVVVNFKFNYKTFQGMLSEETIKEIITHEYVHFLCFQKYGKLCRHNNLFKKECVKIGIPPKTTVNLGENADLELMNFKYTVTCKKDGCHSKSYRQRIRNIDEFERVYVCSKCRGKLNVTQNH